MSRLSKWWTCPQSLYAAAQSPEVFREIIEQMPKASDEAIKLHLVAKMGFVERGADRVVNAFRDTLKHVDILKPTDANDLNGGSPDQNNQVDSCPDLLGRRHDADRSEKPDVIPITLEGNRSVRVVLP